jgi:serine/threonine protein kinase/membrane protein implicated in regulation of membrane protease activity
MGVITPGAVIAGRYRVIQPLGEGGMKAVYLAEDLRFKARRCALAVMVDSFTSDEARRRAVLSFQREADILAQLDHPAIPKVSDRFSEQDHHYFVMDYVAGQTLEAKLASAGGRLEQAEAINIALQICEALDYLHSRLPPIVYRDLKPANIIVTPENRVKLVDFGIARHFTRQGTIIGTIGYAAPEQYQGECEPRSDVYALGATLHHMLSGRDPARFPFDFPPLSTLLSGCDPKLDQLVGEALKRERGERLASAREFAKRLRTIAGDGDGRDESRQRRQSPGMQYCSRCGAEISADANRCPACGATAAIARPSPQSASGSPLLSSAATRLCPQCRRELPSDAGFCPYCARMLQSEPSHRRQPSLLGSNRLVTFGLLAIVTVVAGGLIARGFWGPGAQMPWAIWIIAGLVLMAVEVHYTRDFTLFCFGISALLVGLMSILGAVDIWTQWISFAALSTALLFSAREWLRRKMLSRPGSAELENILGQSAIPLDDLPAYGFGKAELRGTTWSAHNATHMKIVRGQRCKVMKIQGLTLWIMPE